MTLTATTAIMASVVMHVAWNLMARQQPGRAWPLWWVLLFHLVVIAPWGFYHLITQVNWNGPFVALLATSAVANALYFYGLKSAYDRAPVALVYPMVRSSPLLIALWSAVFFGENLGWASWLGILISVAGLALMTRQAEGHTDHRAIPWALVAMLCTSVYSLSDKGATVHLPDFGSVVGFISCGYLLAFVTLTVVMRRSTGHWVPQQRIPLWVIASGGVAVGFAYALVVHAMRELPSAEVVSYTNAGIVVATVFSIFVFGERQQWQRRLFSAVVICIGLAVMALG